MFSFSLVAMPGCNLDNNTTSWCYYAPVLSYSYNMAIHCSTGTPPFDLIISLPRPKFTLDYTALRQCVIEPKVIVIKTTSEVFRINVPKQSRLWNVQKVGTNATITNESGNLSQ